jgi:hypothetical protein
VVLVLGPLSGLQEGVSAELASSTGGCSLAGLLGPHARSSPSGHGSGTEGCETGSGDEGSDHGSSLPAHSLYARPYFDWYSLLWRLH